MCPYYFNTEPCGEGSFVTVEIAIQGGKRLVKEAQIGEIAAE
jgi:hypothetical protein